MATPVAMLLTAVLLCVPDVARAQSRSAGPSAEVERMGRRVDSTLRAAAVMRESLTVYRNANPLRLVFEDSTIIGFGRVKAYFNSDVADLAKPGIAEAERHLQEFGRALDGLKPFVFSIAPDTGLTPYDERLGRVGAVNVRRHFEANPGSPNQTSVESDPQSVASVIVTAVANQLTWSVGQDAGRWASGGLPLAPDLIPKPDWGELRLAVVSSPSPLGRDCFGGDVKACRLFLALDTAADPIRTLLNAAGRRTLVEDEMERSRRASAVGTDRCLGGNDDACIAVLEITGVRPLSSAFVRTSLVVHAITTGGSHDAERLVTTPGPVRASLAAAANQPIDTLVADWARHLGDRAGTAGHMPATLVIAALAWIAACFFLALRSSRWR